MTGSGKPSWVKPEHLQALQEFASQHGAAWKDELNNQWLTGADVVKNKDGHLLRQVRNQCGPTWLQGFKL